MNPYITKKEQASLARDIHSMPTFIRDALKKHTLEEAYSNRPAYQKNDYVGWITRAKQQKTQQSRLQQMLDELKDGAKYMKMKYSH